MAATGINWGSLLPLLGAAGASAFGASTQNGLNGAAQNAARNSQQLYSFGAGTPSGVGGQYTANPGGLGGNVNLNYGNLTGVNNQLQGLAGMFAGAAGSNGVPSALTNGANNAFGVASGNVNPANANANNFYGAANTQLQAAGQDPTAYANGVYSNLTAQAKPWEDAQTAALQDSQFGKGQAGTSGGALQTQAFAQGLGTADLQRQITAQQMGQQQQAQAVANAGNLSGAGNSLLQNAFSNFNQTQNQQQQLAALPAYLQSLQLQNSGTALGQQAGIQTQAQQLYNSGLATNQSNANDLLGAAGQLGANANGTNTSQSPYANLLQSLFGSAANSATNSTGSSLLQQLFGGSSSAAGGEAAPAAAGTAGQTFGTSGALTSATPGGTTTLFGGAADGAGAAGASGAGAAGDAAGLTTTFGAAAGEPALAGVGTGAVNAAVDSAGADAASALGGSGAAGGSSLGAVAGGAGAVGLLAAPLIFGMSRAPIGYSAQWTSNLQNKAQDVLKQGANADAGTLAQMIANTAGVPPLQGLHDQLSALLNQNSNQLMNQRAAASGFTRAQLDAAGTGRIGGTGKGGAAKGVMSY